MPHVSTPTRVPADDDVFDPNRILATLDEHGVEYVLVGGLGARAHGASRETSDIDVVHRSTESADDPRCPRGRPQ
jgi:hypothetical protein